MSSRGARSKGKGSRPAPGRPAEGAQPEVQVSYSSVGQETMAAIHEELTGSLMPGVSARQRDDGPEISVVHAPAGRETLAVIAEEARALRPPQDTLNYGDRISNAPGAKTPSLSPTSSGDVPFAIFEMLTFVVQGPDVAQLSSEAERRRFVEEHLLHRLPTKDMTGVDRVDVTPWTVRGTVVIRVWSKLDRR